MDSVIALPDKDIGAPTKALENQSSGQEFLEHQDVDATVAQSQDGTSATDQPRGLDADGIMSAFHKGLTYAVCADSGARDALVTDRQPQDVHDALETEIRPTSAPCRNTRPPMKPIPTKAARRSAKTANWAAGEEG